MIRIRYRDPNELSPGLHAEAERGCRGTTVYLLSGLTAQQRRSALRRLRLSARMGHCPRLPAGQLALALLADRIRTALGRAGAVFRLHPAGSTVPIMVLSGGAIAFLLFSTVSIRVLHSRPADSQSSAAGTSPVASAGAIPISGASQGQAAGLGGPGQGTDSRQLTQPSSGLGSSLGTLPSLAGAHGGQPGGNRGGASQGGASQGGASQGGASQGGASQGGANQGGASQSEDGQGGGSGTGDSGTTGGGTTLSGGANPSTASAPGGGSDASSAPAATTPAAAPSSSSSAPQPAPSATSSSTRVCVDIGPLGVCLHI